MTEPPRQHIDESSTISGFEGVHSLDELSVLRCNVVQVRTGVLKLESPDEVQIALDRSQRVRGARLPGQPDSMQMDLDPHLHRGGAPGRAPTIQREPKESNQSTS
jgi:hypothetical protein